MEIQFPMTDDFLAIFRPTSADVVAILLTRIQGRGNEFPHRAGLVGLLVIDPDFSVAGNADVDQSRVVGNACSRSRSGLTVARHTVIGYIAIVISVRIGIIPAVVAAAIIGVAAPVEAAAESAVRVAVAAIVATPSVAAPSAAMFATTVAATAAMFATTVAASPAMTAAVAAAFLCPGR